MNENINKYKEQIESERSIDIFISRTRMGYKVKIEKIIGGKLFEVGVIETSNYRDNMFSTDSHLAHRVEEDFKGKGYGQILFDIYKNLVFHTNDAIIPEKEYASKASRMLFLLKNGYRLESKITQSNSEGVKISLLSDTEKGNIINTAKGYLLELKNDEDFLEKTLGVTYEFILEDKEILSHY